MAQTDPNNEAMKSNLSREGACLPCGSVTSCSQVEDKKMELVEACRHHGVERLDLFGSATGEGFDPDRSDLDFVVAFERMEPPNLFDRYFGLKEDLGNLFGREVDLVMEGALRKDRRFAEGVNERSVTLYVA